MNTVVSTRKVNILKVGLKRMKKLSLILIFFAFLLPIIGQHKKKAVKKVQAFKWVNEISAQKKVERVFHKTFKSPSMKVDVGYCIYLPTEYDQKKNKKYPVVYYLHGGRPGSEVKSIRMAKYIHKAISKAKINPVIYVFVNGGPVSHYNLPKRINHMGEDVTIKELIPHIDKTYRTINNRSGRGIEGFSQGGRGTARMMFKHPHLFCSAAPGGGGYATEKRISEEGGKERDKLIFAEGYNTWDLARTYAKNPTQQLKIQFHVGTKGFNYENNLAYMKFMDSLKIAYTKVIVENAPHSASKIYDSRGLEIMKFHSDNFE
jgi:enterochelin esterase-like enzyme